MINFRYHIVSLVAVFLALAIGVVMGSTVIDRVTVETLESQQHRLDVNLAKARQTNSEISGQLDDERQTNVQMAQEAAERLVPASLLDVPVLLIGMTDNEAPGYRALIEELTFAGAKVQATLWLTDRLDLQDVDDRKKLAQLLESDDQASKSLRRTALDRLGASLRSQALGGEVKDPGLIMGLKDAGFIDIDLPGESQSLGVLPGTRVIMVASPQSKDDEDLSVQDKILGESVLSLARSLVGGDQVPTDLVVAEAAAPDQKERARLIEALRDEKSLAGRFSSVDNLDQRVGRTACVLALRDLGVDSVGHYGSGVGAKRLVPAPPPTPSIP